MFSESLIMLLSRYGVEYVEHGPNVKAGNINVSCPFCGDDPSHHLGINKMNGYWGCWRNPSHSGKNVLYLLTQLIPDISYKVLKDSLYNDVNYDWGSSFQQIVNKVNIPLDTSQAKKYYSRLKLPTGFMRVSSKHSNRYITYLESRGFRGLNLDYLGERYNIGYCVSNKKWSERILCPVYRNEELITWVARDITGKKEVRYKALRKDLSVCGVYNTLFDYDGCMKSDCDVLFILEGFFDALKFDIHAKNLAKATCLFSNTVRSFDGFKLEMLHDLAGKYKRMILLLDPGCEMKALSLKGHLGLSNLEIGSYIDDVDDVGSMNSVQVQRLLKSIIL